ncbi:zf-TFIIB domain-containing protein [Gottfriedia solisilvae]|uniref:zf-TFIIB domain-containing protein n=1 Tax=Gottfriedia solisilvae TaxID=1516104 RepID=UPI003D2F05DF
MTAIQPINIASTQDIINALIENEIPPTERNIEIFKETSLPNYEEAILKEVQSLLKLMVHQIKDKFAINLKCPLCEAITMEYRQFNETHIWVCCECPGLLLEYYDLSNIEDLNSSFRQPTDSNKSTNKLYELYDTQLESKKIMNKEEIRKYSFAIVEGRSSVDDELGTEFKQIIKLGFENFTFLIAKSILNDWEYEVREISQ